MFRRIPSRRALAALAKLHGRRLERRWPFLIRAEGTELNLTFADVLEFQYARSRRFQFIVVGAFDGLTNDPISTFVRHRECHGVMLEPQPAVYEVLCANYRKFPKVKLINAAVDKNSGSRLLYFVSAGNADLPAWTEQIASFSIDHLLQHEVQAPGLSTRIRSQSIQTISFDDLLDRLGLHQVDVLQIDAEGMDGQLISWFPFERIRPAVLHYETSHLSRMEHIRVRERLRGFGYLVREADSISDDMAVLL